MHESKPFSELSLNESVVEGIESMGFRAATPIQEQAIPAVLNGRDVLGIAQTGTGKTAAFLLPVLSKILNKVDRSNISALIVVPTRELATQIDQAIQAYAYFTDISSMAIYGGSDGKVFTQEKRALTEGTDIIIATPGRLVSHLNLGYVNFSKIDFLILDEADRMLDMGFFPDIRRITGFCNEKRQSLLFSATMPDSIFSLSRTLLKNPEVINIALSKPPSNVKQGAYVVFSEQKLPVLLWCIDNRKEKSIIIFSSTKQGVLKVYQSLLKKNFGVVMISSDLEQVEREKSLNDFRNGLAKILVATDVVSRGIDIKGIDVVINVDVPADAEDYVHRIGRTGRAEAFGEAFTFIAPDDQIKFKKIEMLIGSDVEKCEIDERFGATPNYEPRIQNNKKKRYFRGKLKK
jgi:ATP-dependent RNA helicase RhlE